MYFDKLSWFRTLVLIESLIIFKRKPLVEQDVAEKIGYLSLFLWGKRNSFIRPAVASVSLSWRGQNICRDLSKGKEWGFKTQASQNWCHSFETCHLVSLQLTYLGFFQCPKVIPWTAFTKSHIASPIWHIMDHLLPNWQFVHWESTQEHILQLVSLQAEHSITFASSFV